MISIATTTIRVERPTGIDAPTPVPDDPWDEGYENPTGGTPVPAQAWDVVVADVRAVISNPGGSEQDNAQELVNFTLNADPCDLKNYDRVVDESTGDIYQVIYAIRRAGLGLDHVHAGLRTAKGVA